MQMCFVWLRLIAVAIFEQQGSGCQGKCCARGVVNRLKMTLVRRRVELYGPRSFYPHLSLDSSGQMVSSGCSMFPYVSFQSAPVRPRTERNSPVWDHDFWYKDLRRILAESAAGSIGVG